MGSRLLIESKEVNGITFVTLSGVVDEDNDLINSVPTGRVIVINAANIERINSCGVRDWVNWLAHIDQSSSYFLAECSPAIMTQVNSVNNFVGRGGIINFFAPYYCPECDKDKMLLLDVGDALAEEQFAPPVCRCDECDKKMEFDDVESSYFMFLGSGKLAQPDPEVVEAARRQFASSGKLRPRTTAPLPVISDSSPSGPGSLGGSSPRLGSLQSLISDVGSNAGGSSAGFDTTPGSAPRMGQPAPFPRKILYIILGMLGVSLLLLFYLAIRLF